MKKIFLFLLILSIKISADTGIETAIVHGDDIGLKSAVAKEDVSASDREIYLDLAQEMVVYWRAQIEVNGIKPYTL